MQQRVKKLNSIIFHVWWWLQHVQFNSYTSHWRRSTFYIIRIFVLHEITFIKCKNIRLWCISLMSIRSSWITVSFINRDSVWWRISLDDWWKSSSIEIFIHEWDSYLWISQLHKSWSYSHFLLWLANHLFSSLLTLLMLASFFYQSQVTLSMILLSFSLYRWDV